MNKENFNGDRVHFSSENYSEGKIPPQNCSDRRFLAEVNNDTLLSRGTKRSGDSNTDASVQINRSEVLRSAKRPCIDSNEIEIPCCEIPFKKRPIRHTSLEASNLVEEKLHSIISRLKIFNGHVPQESICKWSPQSDTLALCSSDSIVGLWNMGSSSRNIHPLLLRHSLDLAKKNADSMSMDWNRDGSLLATSSYDGYSRTWSPDGLLTSKYKLHNGPVVAVRWNKSSNYLLSASLDGTTVIWDAYSERRLKTFSVHSSRVFDIDWKSNFTFASCSADRCIQVCTLGKKEPVKTFKGHTDDITSVKWDPQGCMLASSSNDKTVKIWSMQENDCICTIRAHSDLIHSIRWSPTGPGTLNPNVNPILASASFDSTVYLTDCVKPLGFRFNKHKSPVYAAEFSPDGKLIASGDADRLVYIWSAETGQSIESFKSTGGINTLNWNSPGYKIAATGFDGSISISDLRFIKRN